MRLCMLSLVIATTLALTSGARAQQKPRSSDETAKYYNAKAQTIQDDIDALRKKLDDPKLSMSDANKLIDQMSSLRKNSDTLWNDTTKSANDYFGYKRDEFNKFNDENKKLVYQSAVAGSQTDLLNNVAKNPDKASFESNKEAMSKAWEANYGSRLKPFGPEFAETKDAVFKTLKDDYGIDLVKDGYSRIGTYNPYTGDVYYKYYGKDGKLDWVIFENDAKGWEKYNAELRTVRKRRLEWKDSLEKDRAQIDKDRTALKTTRDGLTGAMAKVESKAKRVNFAGSWSGNDNVGNTVRLTLNSDGSMTYYYGGRARPYSSGGTWTQTGTDITARTSDGVWRLESRITEEFRLEFNEFHKDGDTFQNSPSTTPLEGGIVPSDSSL